MYNKTTGEKVSTIKTEKVYETTDNYLFFKRDEKTICFDLKTWEEKWESEEMIKLTLHEDNIYGYLAEWCKDDDNKNRHFIVVNLEDGKIIWEDRQNIFVEPTFGNTPLITDDYVVTITDRYGPDPLLWVYERVK